jgi:hypothetical protein
MTRAPTSAAPVKAARSRAAGKLPARPLGMLVADGKVTALGLLYAQALARVGGNQTFIASKLGLTKKELTRLLKDEHDTALRLAIEAGTAELAFEMAQIFLNAARNGNVVAGIWASKILLGWKEDMPPPSTQAIQIVLPRPLSADEYAARQREREAIEAQLTVVESKPALPILTRPVT